MSRNINFVTAHQEFELTVTFTDVRSFCNSVSISHRDAVRGARLHVMQSYKAYRFSDIPLAHRSHAKRLNISSNT